MSRLPKMSCFSSLLRIVMLFAAAPLFVACSNDVEPKSVRRLNNQQPGQSPTKPSPETGYNATRFAVLNLISTSQVEKILDIAVNGLKSPYISCQKIESETTSNSTETLRINYDSCRQQGWSGSEEFVVTYDENQKLAPNGIVKIEKIIEPNQSLQSLIYTGDKKDRLDSIHLQEEITLIYNSAVDNGQFSYTYTGGINISYIKSGLKNDDKNKTKNIKNILDAKMVANGQVQFTAPKQFLWIPEINDLPNVKVKQQTSSGSNLILDQSFSMSREDNTPTALACSRPVGLYSSNQINNIKNEKYTPKIVVNQHGQISVPNLKDPESTANCMNKFNLLKEWSKSAIEGIVR